MKNWFSRVARAYEREPGLCLFAASVVLAVAFWHLPVPPFLFADPGSGSGSGAGCSCPVNNCKDWTLIKAGPESPTCDRPPWENCEEEPKPPQPEHKLECDSSGKRIAPKSVFYYERQGFGARCENTSTHINQPGHAAYDDQVYWERTDVPVTASGQSGKKLIEFNPILEISFSGFDHANVCKDKSTGQIVIQSWLYACMSVCGTTGIIDQNKGTGGWTMVTHDFKKEGPIWKFVGEPNPKQVQFNINHECACTVEDDDPDQKVGFKTRIHMNSGVKLGSVNDAVVVYSLAGDETKCSGK